MNVNWYSEEEYEVLWLGSEDAYLYGEQRNLKRHFW